MQVAVWGGGSLGLLWADRLAGEFPETILITRTRAQRDEIQAQGIRVTGVDGRCHRRQIQVEWVASERIPRLDAVFITVKQRILSGSLPGWLKFVHLRLLFFMAEWSGWGKIFPPLLFVGTNLPCCHYGGSVAEGMGPCLSYREWGKLGRSCLRGKFFAEGGETDTGTFLRVRSDPLCYRSASAGVGEVSCQLCDQSADRYMEPSQWCATGAGRFLSRMEKILHEVVQRGARRKEFTLSLEELQKKSS